MFVLDRSFRFRFEDLVDRLRKNRDFSTLQGSRGVGGGDVGVGSSKSVSVEECPKGQRQRREKKKIKRHLSVRKLW